MDEENGDIPKKNLYDIYEKLREVKHQAANQSARMNALERLFLFEFGDETRPGLLVQRITKLEDAVLSVSSDVKDSLNDFKDTLMGDGRVAGVIEQIRRHEDLLRELRPLLKITEHHEGTIKRWTWYLQAIIISVFGLIAGVIKLFIDGFNPK